jgi:hypothetical protein
MDTPSTSLPAPAVHYSPPPWSLLKFPPAPLPRTLQPPVRDHSLANPFSIPADVYNGALSVWVPITIATTYAISVTLLNQVNRKRKNKPWGFSKSKPFYAFVVLHNVFLAVYSAWTFVGMIDAVANSWPGWMGEYGLAGAVDALCKINGPRGLGDAATYDSNSSAWQFTNRALNFGADGLTPDTTDVGRIWNEGLAFYGWLFYLSKFYEVLDTAIILAKGKRSSTLQTYHHAGAMMCMWAGIRYMAPPIWMFVLVNSGIHALMYTYYTLTALSYRVPTTFKRTLTTLQISQFLVGASFAAAHLFVAYDVPVEAAYLFTTENLSSALPVAASTVSSAIASATVSGEMASYLKKMVLRAAGAEGVAENVLNEQGISFGSDAVHAVEHTKAREEVRYMLTHQTIHCTDTSGQAFAIWLNVIYLLPLTGLFVRFFIKSYLKRTQAGEPKQSRPTVEKASKDAWKGIGREVYDAVSDMHGPEGGEEERSYGKEGSSGNAEGEPAEKEEGAEEGPTNSKNRSKGKSKDTSGKKEEDGDDAKSVPAPSDDSKDEESAKDDEAAKQEKPVKEEKEDESSKEEPVKDERGEESSKEEPSEASDSIKNEAADDEKTDKYASAYEASADDLMDKEEKKAEEEMQPGGS